MSRRLPRGAPGTGPATSSVIDPAVRELAITTSQAQLLANLQGPINAAQERMHIAVSAILGQYNIARAQLVGLGGTAEKPVLAVRIEGA